MATALFFNPLEYFLLIIFGLEFGSFANVCIYRWPRNQSTIKPSRSFCPWCRHRISWWENIPLLSFIFLRRKCSHCGSKISWRYPIVEFSLPLLWIIGWAFLKTGPLPLSTPFLLASAFFFFCLLVAALSDLDWKIIPDEITLSLSVVGLLASPWNSFFSEAMPLMRLVESAEGALLGAALLWGIGVFGKFFFGKEAIGGGDVKLMAGIGSILGWQSVFFVLMVGSFFAAASILPALLIRRLKRQQYIPFGPFLAFAALIEFLFRSSGMSCGDILMKIP